MYAYTVFIYLCVCIQKYNKGDKNKLANSEHQKTPPKMQRYKQRNTEWIHKGVCDNKEQLNFRAGHHCDINYIIIKGKVQDKPLLIHPSLHPFPISVAGAHPTDGLEACTPWTGPTALTHIERKTHSHAHVWTIYNHRLPCMPLGLKLWQWVKRDLFIMLAKKAF